MTDPAASVIVAARNNGKYLREAIGSALAQTVDCEVIYVDDCSSDDSLEVARQFASRVKIIPSLVHRGVCAARNRGAFAARSQRYVFLDGDDRLKSDHVEKHLDVMDQETPFAYGPAEIIGDSPMNGHVFSVPKWGDYDVWWRNTVNTSSMYARWAFERAGGWRNEPGTMWDWDLAIRAARLGTPRPSNATLEYRFHGESWSDLSNERDEDAAVLIRQKVRRQNLKISVGCIYSGRIPWFFDTWLSRLCWSIRRANLAEKPELIVVDNSSGGSSEKLMTAIAKYEDVFKTFFVIQYPVVLAWKNETERRDLVASFMASATNSIVSQSVGDAIWLIEDDIVVPVEACDRMVDSLIAGDVPCQAVAGIYRNRHKPEKLVFGHCSSNEQDPVDEILFENLSRDRCCIDAHFSGTGCLMFWKSRPGVPKSFASHWGRIPAHDWRWCADLKQSGGKLVVNTGVRCGHVISEFETLSC